MTIVDFFWDIEKSLSSDYTVQGEFRKITSIDFCKKRLCFDALFTSCTDSLLVSFRIELLTTFYTRYLQSSLETSNSYLKKKHNMKLAIIGDPAEGWAAVGEIVTIILWEFGDKIRNS